MGEIAKAEPGVLDSVQFAGVSANGFAAQSSAALVFFPLKDFDERKGLSAGEIAGALNQKFAGIQDAYIAVFPPPPVIGLGTLGGFKLNVEDRQNRGAEALYGAVQAAMQKAWQDPSLAGVFSSYQINVPQLDVDVDRLKVEAPGREAPTSSRHCRSTWDLSMSMTSTDLAVLTVWWRRRMRRSVRRWTTFFRSRRATPPERWSPSAR